MYSRTCHVDDALAAPAIADAHWPATDEDQHSDSVVDTARMVVEGNRASECRPMYARAEVRLVESMKSFVAGWRSVGGRGSTTEGSVDM
jgi:hypothetical protein